MCQIRGISQGTLGKGEAIFAEEIVAWMKIGAINKYQGSCGVADEISMHGGGTRKGFVNIKVTDGGKPSGGVRYGYMGRYSEGVTSLARTNHLVAAEVRIDGVAGDVAGGGES